MDAKTRHELKQNELAEALQHLRDWDSPSTRYMLVAIVVIAAAYGGWKLWGYVHTSNIAGAWTRLQSTQAAFGGPEVAGAEPARKELQELADGGPSDAVRDFAKIRLAAVYLDQALKTPDQREPLLKQVKALVEPLADSSQTPLVEAAARFALASAHESLREIEAARTQYTTLKDETRLAGSPFVLLAEFRLRDLDNVMKPMAFVPGMKPTEAATGGGPPAPVSASGPAISMPPPATAAPASPAPGESEIPGPVTAGGDEPQPAASPEPAPSEPPAEPAPTSQPNQAP